MSDLVAVGYDDRPGGPPLQKAKGEWRSGCGA
jgi:hypothetical protein